jgi:CHAD domain-containing protein
MASSGKWIDGIGPETTVVDAARRSLELRLAVVAHTLPLAAHLAGHDIEHVHRLRVATRRAAAALKLYRGYLPQKSARWFKKQLRKIRRCAGEARDLDVLSERLQHEPGEKSEPILRFLAEKRLAVQPDIITLADDMRRDDRFIRKAARLFRKLEPAEEESEGESPERFCAWAPRQLETFHSAFVELMPKGADDVDALHQFRIRAKALRYAIELLAPAFESELRKEVYPEVEKLQERLGKITDHIAAIRLFAEWEGRNATETPSVSVSYLDREKALELEDLQDFRDWWAAGRAEQFTQLMASENAIECDRPVSSQS